MSHRNARGQSVPDHLWKIASQVRALVRRPSVMKWWRCHVARWCRGYNGGRMPNEYAILPVALAVHEQYAILAAIHDEAAQQGMELIGPHDVGEEPGAYKGPRGLAVVRYAVLKLAVSEYTEREARRLLGILKKFRRRIDPPFEFSPDYRVVRWGTRRFKFTVRAAACLAYMRGRGWTGADVVVTHAPDMYLGLVKSDEVAKKLEGLELTRRFRDLFKRSPAWGTMIVYHPKKQGLYRLVGPPRPPFAVSRKSRSDVARKSHGYGG